jgi:hypothetical protein
VARAGSLAHWSDGNGAGGVSAAGDFVF